MQKSTLNSVCSLIHSLRVTGFLYSLLKPSAIPLPVFPLSWYRSSPNKTISSPNSTCKMFTNVFFPYYSPWSCELFLTLCFFFIDSFAPRTPLAFLSSILQSTSFCYR